MSKSIILSLCFTSLIAACSSDTDQAAEGKVQSSDVDVCRCLKEPGNSSFSKANEAACDQAISKKLDLADWKKGNLNDPAFKKKWTQLEKECGSDQTACLEREKKAQGCTAKTIKDPNWDAQNCADALMKAIQRCK